MCKRFVIEEGGEDVLYIMNELFFDTFDLLNTAPTVAAVEATAPHTFLSDSDFDQLAVTRRVAEEAIDWKNLPLNVVYYVHSTLPIKTKWGAQVILVVRNKDGDEIKVWTPSNVSKELKSVIKLNNNNSNVYIKSLGQKEAKTSTGGRKHYFDFDVVYL